jgi:hypothetical protein
MTTVLATNRSEVLRARDALARPPLNLNPTYVHTYSKAGSTSLRVLVPGGRSREAAQLLERLHLTLPVIVREIP